MRVSLGGDEWADLRDIGELRRADKLAVLETSSLEIDPAAGKAYVNGANDEHQVDALMARIITNWSLSFPCPKDDPASMGKLTIEQGDALDEAAKPYLELINSQLNPSKRGTDPTAG